MTILCGSLWKACPPILWQCENIADSTGDIRELRFDPPTQRCFCMSGYGTEIYEQGSENRTILEFGNFRDIDKMRSDVENVEDPWLGSDFSARSKKDGAASATLKMNNVVLDPRIAWTKSEQKLNYRQVEDSVKALCPSCPGVWMAYNHKIYPKMGCERKWFLERFVCAVFEAGFLVEETIKYSQVWDTHRLSCPKRLTELVYRNSWKIGQDLSTVRRKLPKASSGSWMKWKARWCSHQLGHDMGMRIK